MCISISHDQNAKKKLKLDFLLTFTFLCHSTKTSKWKPFDSEGQVCFLYNINNIEIENQVLLFWKKRRKLACNIVAIGEHELPLSFLEAETKREQAEFHSSHRHRGRSPLLFWVLKPQVHFSPGSPHRDMDRWTQ